MRKKQSVLISICTLAAAVLVICATAHADTDVNNCLIVDQADGREFYTLDRISRVAYSEGSLQVTTPYGVYEHDLGSIVRMVFVPGSETVGVDRPGDGPIAVGPSHLFQNIPNPFSPETSIAFELPRGGRAELRIYDVNGRLVRTLLNANRKPGTHKLRWDGSDGSGRTVPSGVYFYSLTAPGVDESRKMILAK
jgi:hypothetical protein